MARLDETIAHDARIACEKWREYFKWNIDQYHSEHTFVLGQQWTDDEEELLKTFKKVPMVANKLAAMANQLLGEQQQNTPQLQVVPLTNCDQEVAHLRELIVKDIMFSNEATTVYQVAASQAFIGGFGVFCWDTDYSHRRSFDLEIVPRHFKDSSRCYFDEGAERINKTDGEHAGYITRMSRQKFREVYGKKIEETISRTMSPGQTKEEIALATQPSEGDDPFSWADNEGITLIDHYKRVYEKDTLYKLSNGNVYNQSELDELIEASQKKNERKEQEQLFAQLQALQGGMPGLEGMQTQPLAQPQEGQLGLPGQQQPQPMQQQEQEEFEPQDVGSGMHDIDVIPARDSGNEDLENLNLITLWDNGEPVRIEETRRIKKHRIMHYKIAGNYILDEGEFPSEQLPLIFIDHNSYYDKNGKQVCRTFFGDCRDTQRYINYLRTQSAFVLKVSRYDQFIGSKKNVQGADTQRNWRDPGSFQGLLAYDESPNGHKPEQIMPPELSQSLLSQYQLALEDLYTSTGLYPTRMGQQGNEVSGAAIDARTRQGSYSTFVAFNSINRAIAVGGEIINEMIPMVYDAQRVISLMTPDEGMKNITINKQTDEYGEHIENDIRKGTYEVRLKPGASFEGQKQIALDSLQQILQASPQTFELIADLYADNLPLANTIEIKNRLKTMVPPAIVEAGKTGKMPDQSGKQDPQAQALQAEMQFKEKELALKQQELELKKQEIIMEAQFKIQQLENERLETASELQEQELRYAAETERTHADKLINHSDNLVKILTQRM